ncbi:MAG TPA: two-component sensor histidine kinase [Clostridiales bacterium]|nr:HAMP domain-containing histidine kinase [Clostridia bacterium]HCF65941.1 two-component sensor histidine kinase [Clostridiales bacterium]
MNLLKRKTLIKVLLTNIVIVLLFIIIFVVVIKMQNKVYSKIVNEKINDIINNVMEKYPEVKEEDILKIINNRDDSSENILEKYGYDDELSYIKELRENINKNLINTAVLIGIFGIASLSIFMRYVLIQEKELKEINEYIKEVNNKNYSLKIEDNKDGELSRLRNELYKTTVILREAAENSEEEKEKLSIAIADISHQLKTPLTSIRIMLDNISDNPDMPQEIREDFIQDISKQVEHMSSLVISLLKIAKFDAGTIKMENEEIDAKKLIDSVINNLAILIEIKEIEVITKIDEKAIFIADYKWQQEALTNILKNAIEHSQPKSNIYIIVENTSIFLKIKIKDEGQGIEQKDLKHIFERFYRAKNCNEDSIGIGLSLAKTIIEQNNGYIKATSEVGKGTLFEIKYIK